MKVCLHGRLPEHKYCMVLQLRDRRHVSRVQLRIHRPCIGVDLNVRCTRTSKPACISECNCVWILTVSSPSIPLLEVSNIMSHVEESHLACRAIDITGEPVSSSCVCFDPMCNHPVDLLEFLLFGEATCLFWTDASIDVSRTYERVRI